MRFLYELSLVTITVILCTIGEEIHPIVFDGIPIHTYQTFINRPPENEDVNNDKFVPPNKLYPVYLKLVRNVTIDGKKIRNRDDFTLSIGISKRQSRARKIKDQDVRRRNSTKPSKPEQHKSVTSVSPQMKNSSKKFIKSEQKPSNKNATQKQTSTRPTKLPRRSSLNKLTTRTTTTRATRTTTSRPYKFRSSFLNSTQLLHLPLPLPSRNFSQPHVYSVTVIRRKSITTPAPESLIMVRDTAQQSNKTKDEKPPNIVYPPTGDTSELEDYDDDEEEDEDDVNTEDDKTKDSSEEAADEDQEVINASKSKENASSDVSSKVSQEVKVIPTPTTPAGDKGDKATIAVQADASKKKRKKKKKKKRRKKPEFHFVPAPLGPKADLMIRLDKVHHNVKNIVSVVKGVFTDYVVNRPYVNVELYKGIHAYTYKMGLTPPVNIKYERSNIQPLSQTHTVPYLNPFRNNNAELFSWPSKYPGADLRTKSHQQPLEGSSVENSYQISKRILEEDCADDITCEGEVRRVVPKKLKRPKSKPRPTGRHGHNQVKKNSPLTLPYPIYIESMYDDSNENDPFKHLPPMRPNQFMKAEKNWVKTWDKKTGLPPIAGANEASMHSKRRKGSKKSRRKKKKRGKEQ